MATSTGPDLTGAVEAIAALMDDTAQVRRDNGSEDGVFNENTGIIEEANELGDLIYDGHVLVGKQGSARPAVTEEGGVQMVPAWYELSFPVDAPEFRVGDNVVMTSARRDPQLVNQTYRIREVVQETFFVSRDVVVERR